MKFRDLQDGDEFYCRDNVLYFKYTHHSFLHLGNAVQTDPTISSKLFLSSFEWEKANMLTIEEDELVYPIGDNK